MQLVVKVNQMSNDLKPRELFSRGFEVLPSLEVPFSSILQTFRFMYANVPNVVVVLELKEQL